MNTSAAPASLMESVNSRTRLAGYNRMELLLFSLGTAETFGINVFKVREICERTAITAVPHLPSSVLGIVSLRGSILPVIDLAASVGLPALQGEGKLIITEYSSSTQAFLVADVDHIERVDWERVREPHAALSPDGRHGLVTAITELDDGRLVSILDVEQVLADVMGEVHTPVLEAVDRALRRPVFFVDDSALARRKITEVLDGLKLPHQHASNGREAWERLQQLAADAQGSGQPLRERLGMVLVDAEMPEMDGYVLTRHLKSDQRFSSIPVLMHSSLSSVANRKLGEQVGVDGYVAKFHFNELADAIDAMLRRP